MSEELMDPSEWLAEAQAITVGTKNKVQHLCGDASLVVYHNVDSWTAWCWRCHTRGWVPKEQPNMRERLARKAQQLEIDRALTYQVRPPFPASHDLTTWTASARLWLYKAGLTPEAIARLGAYYHQPTGRVVLPVRDANGETIFWQARNPEYPKDGGAKYISSSVPRDRVHVHYRGADSSTAICLTEDILSAFKVGESGAAEGYAVMGTSLSQHTIALLLTAKVRVYLWFDPDAAGLDACRVIGRQLRLVGLEPIRIVTTKDPKCYSLAEIRSIIDGAKGTRTSGPVDSQPDAG